MSNFTNHQNHRTHVLTPKQRAELVRRYKNGESSKKLAKEFDVHPDYVRVAGRRAGIVRKPHQLKSEVHVRTSRPLIRAAGC